MSAPIIPSMALGRARTAAAGGTLVPYFWLINGPSAVSGYRENDKDAAGPGDNSYTELSIDTLDTTVSVVTTLSFSNGGFTSTGSDDRLRSYRYASATTVLECWFSFQLPAGDYAINVACGSGRTDDTSAYGELWDGTGDITDGDRSLLMAKRELVVPANSPIGGYCDIGFDNIYTEVTWYDIDQDVRAFRFTVTDRGDVRATGIRYLWNFNGSFNSNFRRVNYIRIWQVV